MELEMALVKRDVQKKIYIVLDGRVRNCTFTVVKSVSFRYLPLPFVLSYERSVGL